MTELQKKEINDLISERLQQMKSKDSFTIFDLPFHIHNDIDSPTIPAQFLDFTNFAIWGIGTFNGAGNATITNVNIMPTSVVLVTETVPYDFTVAASCSAGQADITGGVFGDDFNYLIIF